MLFEVVENTEVSTFIDTLFIGFGAQTQAWTHNLKTNQLPVNIFLRKNSSSIEKVKELNYKLHTQQEDLLSFSTVVLLIPDEEHENFFKENSRYLKEETRVIYGHGYSVDKFQLEKSYPQFNHLLLAPKAIASELKEALVSNQDFYAAIGSTENLQDIDTQFLKNFAIKIGINKEPITTTFREEAYLDLFSEQALLCSLLPYASNLAFETAKAKGYNEKLAYIECWREIKLIADAMIKNGPEKLFELISPNALIGGEQRKELVAGNKLKEHFETILDEIESRKFYSDIESSQYEQIKQQTVESWRKSSLNKIHQEMNS